MAKVTIELMKADGRAETGATLQLPSSEPIAIVEIETSAAAQLVKVGGAALKAPKPGTSLWAVKVEGGDVRVKFGADAGLAATPTDGWPVGDGERRTWHAARAGEMCSIIDA